MDFILKSTTVWLFLLLSVPLFSQQHSTKGTLFWVGFMENLSLEFNGPPAFSVIISSDQNTIGTVSVPALALSIPFNVEADVPARIVLPQAIYYPQGDQAKIDLGIKIESELPVNAWAFHYRNFFTEATLLVPMQELSDKYIVTAQNDNFVGFPSEFIVIATEDNTIVNITPSQTTISGRQADSTFSVLLNTAEVFQVKAKGNLSGTMVTTSNPNQKTVLFSGAQQAYLRCDNSDDHLYEQNYNAMLGDSFILIPMKQTSGDVVNILSSADFNDIKINNQQFGLISKTGDYIDTILFEPSIITSKFPISVTQYNKSQICTDDLLGDPTMLILTPIKLLNRKVAFLVEPTGSDAEYVCVIVNSGNIDDVKLDGITLTGFSPVLAAPQFSYIKQKISSGAHILESSSGFNGFVYAFGDNDGYAYHLGFDI